MDPFELLPEEVWIHLMEFCGGNDLLRLSETCTGIKNIIFREEKLSGKLRLSVSLNCSTKLPRPTLDEVKKITEERKISAVKIINIDRFIELVEDLSVLFPMLQHLSVVTEDLYICCYPNRELLCFDESPIAKSIVKGMIHMFLPKLKNLVVENLSLCQDREEDNAKKIPIAPTAEGFNFPLESLSMIDTDPDILEDLSCCRYVKTFTYDEEKTSATNYDATCSLINFFLRHQLGLKVLLLDVVDSCHPSRYEQPTVTADWVEFPFKLQELKVSGIYGACSYTFGQFLEKQDQLKKLSMKFREFPNDQLIEIICRLPCLKELHIINQSIASSSKLEAPFESSNQTVTSITLTRCSSFIGKLAKIFESVENFTVNGGDLGNISHEKLEKVWIEPDLFCSYEELDYRPEFPECKESFEADILKFIKRHSTMLKFVTIEVKPRQAERFEFSLEFCKKLVQKLPRLQRLTLNKVAESNELKKFMAKNRRRCALRLN